MRRRSAGQPSASTGMSTDGRKTPHAIGMDPMRVLTNRTCGIPRPRASDWASASHGASVMTGVCRDIHCTAARPSNMRKRIANAPHAQIVSRIVVQDSVRRLSPHAGSHEICGEEDPRGDDPVDAVDRETELRGVLTMSLP